MSVHYRVFHKLEDLGLVDFDFVCSTVCPILHGQMEFRQKRLSNCARWWNIPNLSQPNPSPQADGTPCTIGPNVESRKTSSCSPCPAYRLRRSIQGGRASRLKWREQPEGDLGHKMAATVAAAFEEGHDACIIVGADVPGSVQQSRL